MAKALPAPPFPDPAPDQPCGGGGGGGAKVAANPVNVSLSANAKELLRKNDQNSPVCSFLPLPEMSGNFHQVPSPRPTYHRVYSPENNSGSPLSVWLLSFLSIRRP